MTRRSLAVDADVEQVRRHRRVVVPDVVMDHLEVPLALAGLHVERDKAVAVEVVARTMAAVLVAERHADGDVDQAEIRIRRVGRPRVVLADARRADLDPFFHVSAPNSPGCGIRLNFQSCLPVLMSNPRIQPGRLLQARRVVAVDVRAADDDDVADDDGGTAGGDLAERGVDADRAVGADASFPCPTSRPASRSAPAACR